MGFGAGGLRGFLEKAKGKKKAGADEPEMVDNPAEEKAEGKKGGFPFKKGKKASKGAKC